VGVGRWAGVGVFAAFSEALERNEPGPFAAAAKELARSAQVPYVSQRYNPRTVGRGGLAGSTRTGLGAAAALLFDEATRTRRIPAPQRCR
jgi:hypothetical protein